VRAGYKVFLYNRVTPTPWVPFGVQTEGASVGVMVTASHNPKEDNGYKVYWGDGPQIKAPRDKGIQASIGQHLAPSAGNDSFDEMAGLRAGPGHVVDVTEAKIKAYLDRLESGLVVDKATMASLGPVVYTAMHGVGADFVEAAFSRANLQPPLHVKEQRDPDPDFPTVTFPNPEEGKSALDLAMRLAEVKGAKYILANDPDADRLAVAEKLPR